MNVDWNGSKENNLDGEGFCLSLKELLLNEISKNYR